MGEGSRRRRICYPEACIGRLGSGVEVWRLGPLTRAPTDARARPKTDRHLPIRSCGPLAVWNRSFGAIPHPGRSTPYSSLHQLGASRTKLVRFNERPFWPQTRNPSLAAALRVPRFDLKAFPTTAGSLRIQFCSLSQPATNSGTLGAARRRNVQQQRSAIHKGCFSK